MRHYEVRTHSSTDEIGVSAENFMFNQSVDMIVFFNKPIENNVREGIAVAAFHKKDVVSVVSAEVG